MVATFLISTTLSPPKTGDTTQGAPSTSNSRGHVPQSTHGSTPMYTWNAMTPADRAWNDVACVVAGQYEQNAQRNNPGNRHERDYTSYAESFRRSSVSITSKHNYVYQQAYRPIYLMVNCERLYVYTILTTVNQRLVIHSHSVTAAPLQTKKLQHGL